MRIVGGRMRGLTLAAVGKGDAGAHLRPTSDRVRESLFNILAGGIFGDVLEDAVVLDLFAGTGALGLEALSRGAASATFVDDGRKAGQLIRENTAKARVQDITRLIRRDARRLGPCEVRPATLVFLDPPYGKGMGATALATAREGGWLAPGALIVWEEREEQAAPEGTVKLDARRYGDSWLTFLKISA